MNRIRTWIIRAVFGRAKSEAPGDENGQARLSWEELYDNRVVRKGAELLPVVDINARVTEDGLQLTEPNKEETVHTIKAGKLSKDQPGWQVGDDIVCVPSGDGWICINKEATERMGIQYKPVRIIE